MKQKPIWKIVIYFFTILMIFLFLFPLVWMLLTSFKSAEEILRVPPTIFPDSLNLNNYQEALQRQPVFRFIFNSLLILLFTRRK